MARERLLVFRPLILRDEIHGDISFDELIAQAIDHPSFQRLRYIKQLGLAEYVFPCANHTRFQHSLGAAYLAGQYFDSIVNGWSTLPLDLKGHPESAIFRIDETFNCVASVREDAASQLYWRRVVTLAGLLHDVGHGPWSHTFELLGLRQNLSSQIGKFSGIIREHFDKSLKKRELFHHEDISLLYVSEIFEDLERRGAMERERFWLPVAALLNRKLFAPDLKAKVESSLSEIFQKFGIAGGVNFHRLLRPLISGPFDVDRTDYIQRDGRNSGVFIGGIEWRRIMNKLLPCLANYPNSQGEPDDVVLISHIKNQHVIDDFIFSLFQMYAQVYLHPKIVGFEERIKIALEARRENWSKFVVDFETHRSLTDENFRDLFRTRFGVSEIDDLLFRKKESDFEVVSYPRDSGMDAALKQNGFSLVDTLDRPMLKDSVGVFLYSFMKDSDQSKNIFIRAWSKVSPLAEQFSNIRYSPGIWIRPQGG